MKMRLVEKRVESSSIYMKVNVGDDAYSHLITLYYISGNVKILSVLDMNGAVSTLTEELREVVVLAANTYSRPSGVSTRFTANEITVVT